MNKILLILPITFFVIAYVHQSDGCARTLNRASRMIRARLGFVDKNHKIAQRRHQKISSKHHSPKENKNEIIRINSPGQRFTATHGLTLKKGQQRNFVFVIDRPDVNYLAISSNIVIKGLKGGPEKYDLYLRYGQPPTIYEYDEKSRVTASGSYVGDVLYSRDIAISQPEPGNYFILLVAKEDFHELLITAVMDIPPDAKEADYTIRRIGIMPQ